MIALAGAGGFVVAALLATGCNWVALRPWRRSARQSWPERARRLYPARASVLTQMFLLTANVVLGARLLLPETPLAAVAVPAFLGTLLGSYPVDRAVFPALRWRSWLGLLAAHWLILLVPWVVFLLAMMSMPLDFGVTTWVIALGVLGLNLAFSAGLAFRLLRLLGLLHPAGERLRGILAMVSARLGVPVRAGWELASPMSNAFALPLTGEVVITRTLLALHPDDEVAAICAHELGHLAESRWVLTGRLVGSLALFPLIFLRPMAHAGHGGLPVLAGAVIGLWLFRLWLSRRMERRADGIAAGHTVEPALYARALERLYQANQMPAVLPRRSGKTHPDLYDRMLAAGVTPDFPRPAPPRSYTWTSMLLLVSFFGLLVWQALLD